MADIFRHPTIANLLPYKISYGFSEGYRTAARPPPNGDGCHPACIALASGLFAAGGCGVPVPQAFMGETQKGLPVPRLPPSLLPEAWKPLRGLLNAASLIRPHGGTEENRQRNDPHTALAGGERANTLLVGNTKSYLFNNITV